MSPPIGLISVTRPFSRVRFFVVSAMGHSACCMTSRGNSFWLCISGFRLSFLQSAYNLPTCFSVPCSEGYYLPSRTDLACSACPVGQYQDEKGQTSCKPCPDNLTTLEIGAFSADMCVSQERVDQILAGFNDGSVSLGQPS